MSWRRQIPNLLTGIRFLLVPYLVWLLLEERFWQALGVFIIMGFSDGMDGYLAKRFDWRTELGEFMDPLADKTMLVSAYVALGWLGLLPKWLVIVVIARDIIILTGAIAYHFLTRQLHMEPSVISKINTLFQIVLVLGVILTRLEFMSAGLLQLLIALTFVTTVISGLDYIMEWSRRATKQLRRGAH
jgi:cardiolipin synthase